MADEYGYWHCVECGVPLAFDEFEVCRDCAEPRVKFFFRWYDLWVGAYIDVPNKVVYICPLPMVGVRIRWL